MGRASVWQKPRRYRSRSLLGYSLQMIERILVPAQTAMLLFAVRHRFRR
jgi:hypothetical protein